MRQEESIGMDDSGNRFRHQLIVVKMWIILPTREGLRASLNAVLECIVAAPMPIPRGCIALPSLTLAVGNDVVAGVAVVAAGSMTLCRVFGGAKLKRLVSYGPIQITAREQTLALAAAAISMFSGGSELEIEVVRKMGSETAVVGSGIFELPLR